MISRAHILEWQSVVLWPSLHQVEHDLILSRAICGLYQNPIVQENLVFRGGTALHKLFFDRGGRFSEDLDFVQVQAEPIGNTIAAVRDCLDHWLGKPSWKQNEGRFTLLYRFETETDPVVTRKVKIEINTREHFSVLPLINKPYSVENSWFTESTNVKTYALEELMGTKLRALYQRKKGRDLYDFWYVTKHHKSSINHKTIINIFQEYLSFAGQSISRAEFEKNIYTKMKDNIFNNDVSPLLASDYAASYDRQEAYKIVLVDFIAKLPGEPWKGKK